MRKKLTAREFQLLLIRDAHLRQGNFDKASINEIGHLPISRDLLIQCGIEAEKKCCPEDAIEAYKMANALERILEMGKAFANGEAGPDNYERHLIARQCFELCSATNELLWLGLSYLNFLDSLTVAICDSLYISMAYRLLSMAKAGPELIQLGHLCQRFGEFETAINCFTNANATQELNDLGTTLLGMQKEGGGTAPTEKALRCFLGANNREEALMCAAWFIRLGKSPATSHRIEIGLTVYKELKETVPEPLVNEVMDALIATGATSAVDYVSEKFAVVRFHEQNRKPTPKTRRPRRKVATKVAKKPRS